MKKFLKKLLSVTLSIMMLLAILPANLAFAEGDEAPATPDPGCWPGCALTEHTHTDACYDIKTLGAEEKCAKGLVAHAHTEACYTKIKVPVLKDDGTPVLDDAGNQTIEEVSELSCTIPEHEHSVAAGCYALTCTLAEHTHAAKANYCATCGKVAETAPEHDPACPHYTCPCGVVNPAAKTEATHTEPTCPYYVDPAAFAIEGAGSVVEGKSITLTAKNQPEGDIAWSSSDEAVATVTGGTVTGVKVGVATITATAGGKSATKSVQVVAPTKVTVTFDSGEHAHFVDGTDTPETLTKEFVKGDVIDASAIPTAEYDANFQFKNWSPSSPEGAIAGDVAKYTIIAEAIPDVFYDVTIYYMLKGENGAADTELAAPDVYSQKDKTSENYQALALDGYTLDGSATAEVEVNGGDTSYSFYYNKAAATPTPTGSPAPTETSEPTPTPISGRNWGTITLYLNGGSNTQSPSKDSAKDCVWTSSNESVAVLTDNQGQKITIVAKGIGTAYVTASKNGEAVGYYEVVVTSETPPEDSRRLGTLYLTVGGELETGAINSNNKQNFQWTASNGRVELIGSTTNNSVTIKPISAGIAYVTVSYEQKGKWNSWYDATAYYTVIVSPAPTPTPSPTPTPAPAKISSIAPTDAIYVGGTQQLTAYGADGNPLSAGVTWSNGTPDIARVNAAGLLSGIAAGTATITATYDGFSKSVTIEVKDMSVAGPSEISLFAEAQLTTVGMGEVEWSSGDPAILSVDALGKVKGLAVGTATVTATNAAGVSRSITIEVKDNTFRIEGATISVGETKELARYNASANVTWSSSNPDLASVDSTGKVTGVAIGTVTITAEDGDETAHATVIVRGGMIEYHTNYKDGAKKYMYGGEGSASDKPPIILTKGGKPDLINTVFVEQAALNEEVKIAAGYSCLNAQFTGWNTAADGSGTKYAAGDTYKLTQNLTLYAQWTDPVVLGVTVKVTYKVDGATDSFDATTSATVLTIDGEKYIAVPLYSQQQLYNISEKSIFDNTHNLSSWALAGTGITDKQSFALGATALVKLSDATKDSYFITATGQISTGATTAAFFVQKVLADDPSNRGTDKYYCVGYGTITTEGIGWNYEKKQYIAEASGSGNVNSYILSEPSAQEIADRTSVTMQAASMVRWNRVVKEADAWHVDGILYVSNVLHTIRYIDNGEVLFEKVVNNNEAFDLEDKAGELQDADRNIIGWTWNGGDLPSTDASFPITRDYDIYAKHRIKDVTYTVQYYYDGVEDTAAKEEGSGEIGSTITGFIPKPVKDEKTYQLEKIDPAEGIKLDTDASKNVLSVYYVTPEIGYTVNYYKNEVSAENLLGSFTDKATLGDKVSVAAGTAERQLDWKKPETGGYNSGTATPAELTISEDPASNVISVVYPRQSYTVSYTVDESELTTDQQRVFEAPNGGTYYEGDLVNVAELFIPGYTFEGWTAEPAVGDTSKFAADGTASFNMPGNSVVLSGKFVKRDFNVIARGHNGTVSLADDSGYKQVLTAHGPTYSDIIIYYQPDAGYEFEKIVIDVADAKKKQEFTTPSENYQFAALTDNHTIDVYYKAIGHKVIYDNNASDATGTMDNEPYAYKATVTVAENGFTRTGYSFTGWNTVPNGTGTAYKAKATFTMPNKDVTLYAQWEKSTFYVIYSYTGTVPAKATPAPATASATMGDTVTVEAAPTLDGYDFSGWATEDAAVTNGASFTMPEKNVEFTGSWTARTDTGLKIEYYLEKLDGTGYDHDETHDETRTGTTDATYTVSAAAGDIKSFTGFIYDENNANNVKSGTITSDGKLVLKLYYKRDSYIVRFYNDDTDKTLIGEAKSYKYGETITVPGNPSKAADAQFTYTFAGWNEYDNATVGAAVTFAANPICTGNADYIARYTTENVHYSVVFYDEDGTTVLGSKYDYKYNDQLAAQPDPTKPSDLVNTYSFSHWASEKGGTAVTPATPVTQNAVYYAVYTPAAIMYTLRASGVNATITAPKAADLPLEYGYDANASNTVSFEAHTGYEVTSITVDDAALDATALASAVAAGSVSVDKTASHDVVVTATKQKRTVMYTWTVPTGFTLADIKIATLPAQATVDYGDDHTVDTTAYADQSVTGGVLRFNGWDKSGTITKITENVTITGAWVFINDGTLVLTPYTGVYDAAGHSIVVYESVANDTFSYRYKEQSAQNWIDNGATNPSFTNVGVYDVEVTATQTGYATRIQQSTVTITPRPVNFTGESKTLAYTGEVQTITGITAESVTTGRGLISGHNFTGLRYSATGTEPGEYDGTFVGTVDTVVITDENNKVVTSNYAPAPVIGKLTIEDYTVTYVVTGHPAGEGVDANGVKTVQAATLTPVGKTTNLRAPYTPPAGYIFNGWTAPDGVTVTNNTFTMPEKDLTFTGTLTRVYKVSYAWDQIDEPEGATLPSDADEYAAGANVPIAADPAAITGYSFDGWYSKDANTPVANDAANFVMPAHDMTLYGKWSKQSYPVTYSWGSNAPKDGELTHQEFALAGAMTTVPVLPTVSGNQTFGSALTRDMEYTSATVLKAYDEFGNVTKTWTFSGWTGTTPADLVVNAATGAFTMPASAVAFTGSWTVQATTPETYTVAYAYNWDGPEASKPAAAQIPALPTGGELTVNAWHTVAATPTTTSIEIRDNGKLKGIWAFDTAAGWAIPSAAVTDTAHAGQITSADKADLALTGTWRFTPWYTITYQVNDATRGSLSRAAQGADFLAIADAASIVDIQSVGANLYPPTLAAKEGFYFAGWDETPLAATTVTGDKTYTARFAPNGTITVTPEGSTVVYDGIEHTLDTFTVAPNDYTGDVEALKAQITVSAAGTNVGSYAMTFNQGAPKTVTHNGKTWDVTYGKANLVITARPVSILATAASKPYDNDVNTPAASTLGYTFGTAADTGFVGSDASAYTIGVARKSREQAAKVYENDLVVSCVAKTDAASVAIAKNYTISTTPADFTITPLSTLTVSHGNQSKVYDGEALVSDAATVSVTGAKVEYKKSADPDTAWSSDLPSITNVAESTLTVNVRASMPNYLSTDGKEYATASYTLTITPRPVTITGNSITGNNGAVTVPYKAAEYAATTYSAASAAQDTGLLANDTANINYILKGTNAGSYTGKFYAGADDTVAAATAADVTITRGRNNDDVTGNYTVSLVPGTLTIAPAVLTAAATDRTMTYGTLPTMPAHPVLGTDYRISGFVGSDNAANVTITGEPVISLDTGRITVTTNAGSYSEAVRLAAGSLKATNYTFDVLHGNLTITAAKTLSVSHGDQSKTYDSTALVSEDAVAKVDGTVNTAATIEYSTDGGTNWSTTPPQITNVAESCTVNVRASLTNYETATDSYKLTVTRALLSFEGESDSFVYNGLEQSIDGITLTPPDGFTGTLTYEGVTYEAKGTNVKTHDGEFAGTPVIKLSNDDVTDNFNISYAPGALTITHAVLTATAANRTMSYGVLPVMPAAPALGTDYTLSGFVGNDDAANVVITGAPVISLDASITAATDVGGYDDVVLLAEGSLTTANYTFITAPGDLTVEAAKTLTVNHDDQAKIYDADPLISTAATSVAGATIEYSTDGGATWSADLPQITNVDESLTVSVRASHANYLTAAGDTFAYDDYTLTVTPRALLYAVSKEEKVYGNAMPDLASYYALTGFVGGDDATVLGLAAADYTPVNTDGVTDTTDVGLYTMGVPAMVLAHDEEAERIGNYYFDPAIGTLEVTPRPITITANNQWKAFGAADPVLTYVATGGFVGADEAGFAIFCTRAPGEAENGNYAITPHFTPNANYTVTPVNGNLHINPAPTFLLTYIVDGGNYGDGTVVFQQAFAAGAPIGGTPADPTQDGYTFGGWSQATPAVMPAFNVTITGTLTAIPPEPDPDPDPEPDPEPERFTEEDVPLAAPDYKAWALVNLILAVLTALGSALLLIGYIGKKKREADAANGIEASEIKKKGGWRLGSLIPGIGAIVAFILTENIKNPMVLVDGWTLLMVAIALIQVGVAILAGRSEKEIVPENKEN